MVLLTPHPWAWRVICPGVGPSGQTSRFQDGLSGAVEVPGLALHLGRLFIAEPHKRSSAT